MSPTPGALRQRLQPALLDRLTDETRLAGSDEPAGQAIGRAELRAAVLRDLGWLLNAVQPLAGAADADPRLAASVLNFGLPPLAGQLASCIDTARLEKAIREAIVRFEPRILGETLRVQALEPESVLETHNVIVFEIRGHLWAEPTPLELWLHMRHDLEGGQVRLHDLGRR